MTLISIFISYMSQFIFPVVLNLFCCFIFNLTVSLCSISHLTAIRKYSHSGLGLQKYFQLTDLVVTRELNVMRTGYPRNGMIALLNPFCFLALIHTDPSLYC